jgi:hypothetical protein
MSIFTVLRKKVEILMEIAYEIQVILSSDRKIYWQYRSGNVHNDSTTFVLYSGINNSISWILAFIAFCDEPLH